jgi:hypothetical protein
MQREIPMCLRRCAPLSQTFPDLTHQPSGYFDATDFEKNDPALRVIAEQDVQDCLRVFGPLILAWAWMLPPLPLPLDDDPQVIVMR